MSAKPATPWHKLSYDLFLNERLPLLLAERLPLSGYQVVPEGEYTVRIEVGVQSASAAFAGIPLPDEDGLFFIQEEPVVVVPQAADDDLEHTTIRCVGELLYDSLAGRLGQSPEEIAWESELLKAWLPLGAWISEFFLRQGQRLDSTNWLSRNTHLRRLVLETWHDVNHPSQRGRVCPFEMPEGDNLGRVFTISRGAAIQDGKLVSLDPSPQAGLGLTAATIPFIEHNDPNRTLMGTNMLRQWIERTDPEPALVQTGFEPAAAGFWNGRNLLTAFTSWGAGTIEDGIILSESAASKLDIPYPAEPGDKLSNRFGTKGVVSGVLPDAQMPHLEDGTAVELIYNFASLHMRLNFGQILEAVMGRAARIEGQPVIVPPYQAPSLVEILNRLQAAGLPETGMEYLSRGKGGKKLRYPTTVGWVYWGRTVHLAREKVRLSVSKNEAQRCGEMETSILQELGAFENLREILGLRSARQPEVDRLASQAAAGPLHLNETPPPIFQDVLERLSAAGISMQLAEGRLAFKLQPPGGEALQLAAALPHPWLSEHAIQQVGVFSENPGAQPLIEANQRLAATLEQHVPQKMQQDAKANLEKRLQAYFDHLLTPEHLRLGEYTTFSARAVISPARGLRLDQVGLPEEIAWGLFGPLAARKLKDPEAVAQRTKEAESVLDEAMQDSWILVNRAPTITPEAIIAFHPVRDPSYTIRLHPLTCQLLNADFDGDLVAVFLPLTQAAQTEAGERLSVMAHLQRNPGLLGALLPPLDSLWGLAHLSLEAAGRKKIEQVSGGVLPADLLNSGQLTGDPLTAGSLLRLIQERLTSLRFQEVLEILERLTELGFAEAAASGASLSPFAGQSLPRPVHPSIDDPSRWQAYNEELEAIIASYADYLNPDLGPQALMVRARGKGLKQLAWLVGSDGMLTGEDGTPLAVRGSLVRGLSAPELSAVTLRARRGLAQLVQDYTSLQEWNLRHQSTSFYVLGRARRAAHPGIVFARAAASGEFDPLVDVESRLFTGLPIR